MRPASTKVGETGASCYNFHSKSLFQTNMQAPYFICACTCNITYKLFDQNYVAGHLTSCNYQATGSPPRLALVLQGTASSQTALTKCKLKHRRNQRGWGVRGGGGVGGWGGGKGGWVGSGARSPPPPPPPRPPHPAPLHHGAQIMLVL